MADLDTKTHLDALPTARALVQENAKENGLNPLPYLTYLFEQLPNVNLKDPQALDRLLPWTDAIQEQFHIPVKHGSKA